MVSCWGVLGAAKSAHCGPTMTGEDEWNGATDRPGQAHVAIDTNSLGSTQLAGIPMTQSPGK